MNYIKESLQTVLRAFTAQMRVVLHDEGIILFLIFLPLVYPILYSLIYNPELVREVKAVVVDHDRTPSSRELVRRLNASQYVDIIGYAADMPEARKAVDSHKCYGIFEIPEGFQRKTVNGEGSELVAYSEMSLLLRYRGLLTAATDVAMDYGAEIREETINRSIPIAGTVVTGDGMGVNSIFMGNIESGFDSFVMPGVLILILQQCFILAVGMAGGARHEYPRQMGFNPMARRPHTLARMIGEVLCFFAISLLPTVWLIHYVPMIFSFPVAGDIWQELLFIMPLTLGSILLGFVLQGVVYQREQVFVIWVVTSLAFLFLSGLTWPRFAMSEGWQIVGGLVPATWGVEGFILMNTNGSTLPQVEPMYIRLWVLVGLYLVVGYAIQRWRVLPMLRRRTVLLEGTAQDAVDSTASED